MVDIMGTLDDEDIAGLRHTYARLCARAADAGWRLIAISSGTASSCAPIENVTSAIMDFPYRNPMNTLPRNQNTPYTVLNNPKAEPRFPAWVMDAMAARITDP